MKLLNEDIKKSYFLLTTGEKIFVNAELNQHSDVNGISKVTILGELPIDVFTEKYTDIDCFIFENASGHIKLDIIGDIKKTQNGYEFNVIGGIKILINDKNI